MLGCIGPVIWSGSYLVATHLRRWMIEPGVAHEWVGGSLSLGQYVIARGNWDYRGPARLEAPSVAVAAAETVQKPPVTKVAAAETVQKPPVTKVADAETVQKPKLTNVASGAR